MRPPRRGRGASVHHLASHARLLRDVSTSPAPSSRSGRPDAIIVPAARPASGLAALIELAADLQTQLVILCSRQAKADQVADRVSEVPQARALVVQIDDYRLPDHLPDMETSSDEITEPNMGRTSDLSLKRNFGLLLARLRRWRKIVFVDDDITLRPPDIRRIANLLDNHRFAGMACREFPDNSVFCHARRLAKLPQDVFVSGGVLGVNCGDLPLPFFPDIYNEDWFFFGEAAARRRLAKAGEAHQKEYDPFAGTPRACHQEFGDLLAEGLYYLIEKQGPVGSFREITELANARYWSRSLDVRRHDLDDTRSLLECFTQRPNCSDNVYAAIMSLEAADRLYDKQLISAEHCVRFLEAWQQDLFEWERAYSRINKVDSMRDAMDWLGATTWQPVRDLKCRAEGAARTVAVPGRSAAAPPSPRTRAGRTLAGR